MANLTGQKYKVHPEKKREIAERMSKKWPLQEAGYERRVRQLEKEGLTRSDAQGVVDAEIRQGK